MVVNKIDKAPALMELISMGKVYVRQIQKYICKIIYGKGYKVK